MSNVPMNLKQIPVFVAVAMAFVLPSAALASHPCVTGLTSDKVSLTVQEAQQGTPITLTASVAGGDAPYTYRWYVDWAKSLYDGTDYRSVTVNTNQMRTASGYQVSLQVKDNAGKIAIWEDEKGVARDEFIFRLDGQGKLTPLTTPKNFICPEVEAQVAEVHASAPVDEAPAVVAAEEREKPDASSPLLLVISVVAAMLLAGAIGFVIARRRQAKQ